MRHVFLPSFALSRSNLSPVITTFASFPPRIYPRSPDCWAVLQHNTPLPSLSTMMVVVMVVVEEVVVVVLVVMRI